MLEYLKNEANTAYTENGAVSNATTGSDCLDLFATIGALRRASDEEMITRFVRAYTENRDAAMKLLFFARDIRGGLGERRVFRVILRWLACNEPASVRKNLARVAEYGRYDDLLVLLEKELARFNRENPWEVEHIALAKRADVFLVAPATANFIGKAANGIADDMLSTTLLATKAPILLAPAMNTGMWTAQATQDNLKTLQERGVHTVGPASGMLACGDTGAGRMSEPEEIVEAICKLLTAKQDLAGKKVLVTAGPTVERIDPVRYLTNDSSGKMGYAIAQAAAERGAQVTIVSGPVHIAAPQGVTVLPVQSTMDLYHTMLENAPAQDIVIQAAAPADYRVENPADQKIKKQDGENLTLTYGEYTGQKFTATVEQKDGYVYQYQWIDGNVVISNTDTLAIPDDLPVGEYDYYLAVGAKRTDNGEIAWYTNRNLWVKVNPKELDASNVTLSQDTFSYDGNEQKPTIIGFGIQVCPAFLIEPSSSQNASKPAFLQMVRVTPSGITKRMDPAKTTRFSGIVRSASMTMDLGALLLK